MQGGKLAVCVPDKRRDPRSVLLAENEAVHAGTRMHACAASTFCTNCLAQQQADYLIWRTGRRSHP